MTMPPRSNDLNQVRQYLRYTPDDVSCRHCGQNFVTVNCDENARQHVRDHIRKGQVVLELEMESGSSDSGGNGE